MKKYKHKTNGSNMTYKDGCMRIENLVIEGEPNLDYWEEVKEHSIMMECIKRFPKGSRVRSALNGSVLTIRTEEWTEPQEDNWFEGVYYYGSNGNISAMREGEHSGFFLYYDGKFAEKVECYKEFLFLTEDGKEIFEGDGYWYVNIPPYEDGVLWEAIFVNKAVKGEDIPTKDSKDFATKQAAENYIKMNKPCLSLKEVLDNYSINRKEMKQKLTKIIKPKL